jgi:hypothetical protein
MACVGELELSLFDEQVDKQLLFSFICSGEKIFCRISLDIQIVVEVSVPHCLTSPL